MKTEPLMPKMAFPSRLEASRRFAATSFALLSSFALAQAEVIEFDLSLAPVGVTSPLSGGEVSGGITFDTVTSRLTFAIGYGSAAGFTNLTGAATGLHIHGADDTVLFDLSPVHFVSGNGSNGGVILGSVVYTAEKAADLLKNLNYVNIHTSTNPGGEVRGQLLVDSNAPPVVGCPASATVECGDSLTYTAMVSDADGDALQVTWSLNGQVVQTDDVPAGNPTTDAQVEYTAALPLGVNELTVTATDSEGNVSTCTSTITVEDTTPPVIVSASVNPKKLWPVNHKMVPVRVSANVTDACGETTWKIVSISSSEPDNGKGDGNTAPDWKITGDDTANLRAERSGKNKAGRVYTLTLEATDASGNVSTPATVTVTVPHSQGTGKKS